MPSMGRKHVTTEAEIGVTQLQTREGQARTGGHHRKPGKVLPRVSEGV